MKSIKVLVLMASAAMLISSSVMAYNFGGGGNDKGGNSQDQSQRQSQMQGQNQSQSNYSRNSNRNRATGIGVGVGYSEGSNADNAMTLNQTYEQEDNIRIKNTPDAYAPALTTSNGTCMGSSSVGGSGPGIGLSIGSTWTDKECTLRYNAEIMHNMGYKDAVVNIMCQSEVVASAAPTLCGKASTNEVAVNPEPVGNYVASNPFF